MRILYSKIEKNIFMQTRIKEKVLVCFFSFFSGRIREERSVKKSEDVESRQG